MNSMTGIASAHIALVEDDDEIRDLVAALLAREGWQPHSCRTAADFDALMRREKIDLALLDIMLPGEDGLSLCRRIRAEGNMPLMIVSARDDDVDRIVGLEIGADDYLPKPFNPRELVARVRALLRRAKGDMPEKAANKCYEFGGWRWDVDMRRLVAPDGAPVDLTGGEHDMLLCLVEHAQRTLSRDQLLEWTRGRAAGPFDRTIDVQIGRLRRRLELHDPSGMGLIKTVRGGGYLFTAAVHRARA